jgi:signal transduction histidine kinase
VVQAAIAQAAPGADSLVGVDLPTHLPVMTADPDRLEDVLANLIGNARKFSPVGASVLVRGRAKGDTVQISVIDGGKGIAPEELDRIFGRFYQVHRGSERSAGGSGLGLYIARAYVSAMHGTIQAESTPGAGSTFTVTLPAAATLGDGTEKDTYEPIAYAPAGGR